MEWGILLLSILSITVTTGAADSWRCVHLHRVAPGPVRDLGGAARAAAAGHRAQDRPARHHQAEEEPGPAHTRAGHRQGEKNIFTLNRKIFVVDNKC